MIQHLKRTRAANRLRRWFKTYVAAEGRMRRAAHRTAERELRSEPELWQILAEAGKRSISTGCQLWDYAALVSEVRSLRPAAILECGSGISTCAIAWAVRRNAEETGEKARFISMEESEHYRDGTRRLLPDDLLPWVELRHSPVASVRFGDWVGFYYADTPGLDYALVFVDGPQLPDGEVARRDFDADYLRAVLRNPGTTRALVDGRRSTREALRALLPGAACDHDPVRNQTRFSARRRDAAVHWP